MTVCPDRDLRALIKDGLITGPADPFAGINPASIDLRLGNQLLIESMQESGFVPYPFDRHTEAKPYELRPGQFVLAATAEVVAMPDTHAGQVQLKSSVARLGLEHLMAGWIDPGFAGTITLELHNSRQLQPVMLWPGMRIAQLVVLAMSGPCDLSYELVGRYNGQALPTPSLGVPA